MAARFSPRDPWNPSRPRRLPIKLKHRMFFYLLFLTSFFQPISSENIRRTVSSEWPKQHLRCTVWVTKAASLLHLKNDLVETGMLPWILLSSFVWSPLLVPSPRTRQGGWGWRSTSSPGTGAGVCLVQMLGRPGCWADDINGLGNWNYCPGEEARSCLLLPSHSWLCLLCMAGFCLDKKKISLLALRDEETLDVKRRLWGVQDVSFPWEREKMLPWDLIYPGRVKPYVC